MKERIRGTLGLGFLIFAVLVSTPVGQTGKQQEKLLAEIYPNHIVFSPTRLARGKIAIEDANGRFGEGIEIGKLQYSDKALILLGKVGVASEFNVKNLSAQIERGKTVAAAGCSTTWVYHNETFLTGGAGDCLLLKDPEMFASYQERTKTSLPTRPFIRARLARTLNSESIFRCKYTVTGTTTCNNSCNCPTCVTCAFDSDDMSVSATVPQPDRNHNSTSHAPCNSKTHCGGFPGPGSPAIQFHENNNY